MQQRIAEAHHAVADAVTALGQPVSMIEAGEVWFFESMSEAFQISSVSCYKMIIIPVTPAHGWRQETILSRAVGLTLIIGRWFQAYRLKISGFAFRVM